MSRRRDRERLREKHAGDPKTENWGWNEVELARLRIAAKLWEPYVPVGDVPGLRFECNTAGRCEKPRYTERVWRGPKGDGSKYMHVTRGPTRFNQLLIVDGKHRCRNCSWCRRQRSLDWAERSRIEGSRAHRGWFVTLTFGEMWRAQMHAAAVAEEAKPPHRPQRRRGSGAPPADFEAAGAYFAARPVHRPPRAPEGPSRWQVMAAIAGRQATLWLKRVREVARLSPGEMSYVLVTEKHKDGYPHLHLLMWELTPRRPLTKRLLEGAWRSHDIGITDAVLVRTADNGIDRVGAYVAKYLTKEAGTRIRGSEGYGALSEVEELCEVSKAQF